MKKLIIFLPILFIVTLVFPNNLSWFHHSQKVNKEIKLSIFTQNNYSSAAYDDAQATVAVTVSKVMDNKKLIISRQSFTALQLKQFPSAINAITKQLSIDEVMKSNEMLMVTYTISYNSNGSILTFENNEIVNKETAKDTINIAI